jgi:hypothetical protein
MRRSALLAAAALLAAPPARAVDVNDGQLAIHGDGAWSFQRTSNGNGSQDATPEGNYDLASFNLLIAARPSPRLTITADLAFDPHHVGLEWMFVEWRASDRLRLRAGRVKQPIGNSGELVFAGTTRAFYNLPTSIYGPANMVGTAYLGLGATGEVSPDSAWSVTYDAYAGALKLSELETYRALERPAKPGLDRVVALDRQQVREIVGGRLSLATPFEFTARVSGFGGRLQKDDGRRTSFLTGGLSAEYRLRALRLDAEIFLSDELGVEHSVGAHLTTAWWFDEHWQAALRLESDQTWVAQIAGVSPLQRHRELALGLDYWFSPLLVVKASVHRVDGNHFVFPAQASYRDLVTSPPERLTTLVLLGTQFAF